ncbi:hypothetical protein SCP_0900700 [Sparassis crispa]|uniref:Uncharacterized protein n=1 Tax=Sparassis crispa TaxID=139825 RepID=A0A401GVG6_9APHY|nr:hypothetical protein SCP_0900700 [Sparassis crispa]GBE86192.1 hypothetical protein SCP_0900700 [Sparassis crispa]
MPILYAAEDTVEKWLNSLLCLNVTVMPRSSAHSCPHPAHSRRTSLLSGARVVRIATHPDYVNFLCQAPKHLKCPQIYLSDGREIPSAVLAVAADYRNPFSQIRHHIYCVWTSCSFR